VHGHRAGRRRPARPRRRRPHSRAGKLAAPHLDPKPGSNLKLLGVADQLHRADLPVKHFALKSLAHSADRAAKKASNDLVRCDSPACILVWRAKGKEARYCAAPGLCRPAALAAGAPVCDPKEPCQAGFQTTFSQGRYLHRAMLAGLGGSFGVNLFSWDFIADFVLRQVVFPSCTLEPLRLWRFACGDAWRSYMSKIFQSLDCLDMIVLE